jgi:hypothetical protein
MTTAWQDLPWTRYKRSLRDRGNEWLKDFEKPLDIEVLAAIQALDLTPPPYEPLLVEQLLTDVSSLLDRCLAYRREAYELELSAVSYAAEYSLFLDLAPINEQVELLSLKAAQALAKEPPVDDSPKGPIATKWRLMKEHRAELQRRHETRGNAHNFPERYKRVLRLLAEDIREASVKASCAAIGLKLVYGITEPLLPPTTENVDLNSQAPKDYLDELVAWTRTMIRELERLRERWIEYDLVVPVSQPWAEDGSELVPSGPTAAAFKKDGLLELRANLAKSFPNLRNVRLRALGLSLGWALQKPGPNHGYEVSKRRAYRYRAIVFTPLQRGVKQASYRRPPVHLGDVGVFWPDDTVALEGGPAVHNVDPRGEWIIRLDRRAAFVNEKEITTETLGILDLKIHLRVAAESAVAAVR